MSMLSSTITTLGLLGSLAWIAHLIHLVRYRTKLIYLSEQSDQPPLGGWPSLSIIFGARDESRMVEQATRSMLDQDYPDFEVIALDDRSIDATGAILDAIAIEAPRLRVIHVRDLPAGWLGKTNALQSASESTSSRWILFTDGDVVYQASSLKRAIALAEREKLDHLAVGPEVLTESVGERLFLMMFGLLFSMKNPIGRIDDPMSKVHAGIGGFNLVRAESFRAIGGFRRIALSVDDDMRLAQALKFAGYRTRLILGEGAVSVRWQIGLGGMIRGLEKNFFAAIGFSPLNVLIVTIGIIAVGIMPYLGLWVGPWWGRVGSGLGIGSIALILAGSSRQSRIGWLYTFLIPIAAVTTMIALVRSVALTYLRGGVQWRGHLYPIQELKAHVRSRDAWTSEVWRSTR